MKPGVLEKFNTLALILGLVFMSYIYMFKGQPIIHIHNYIEKDTVDVIVVDSAKQNFKVNLKVNSMKLWTKKVEVKENE